MRLCTYTYTQTRAHIHKSKIDLFLKRCDSWHTGVLTLNRVFQAAWLVVWPTACVGQSMWIMSSEPRLSWTPKMLRGWALLRHLRLHVHLNPSPLIAHSGTCHQIFAAPMFRSSMVMWPTLQKQEQSREPWPCLCGFSWNLVWKDVFPGLRRSVGLGVNLDFITY